MLTENGAGVLSGMIVETTCTWTPQGFLLHSPSLVERTRKMWISQGLMSKWGVVIADLIIAEEKKGEENFSQWLKIPGPHAFIVKMNTPGIEIEDMPQKTAFNSLDNCFVSFDNVLVPLDAMLSGISYVTTNGKYKLRDPNVCPSCLKVLSCVLEAFQLLRSMPEVTIRKNLPLYLRFREDL
jgi:acyl-CoA oxidase